MIRSALALACLAIASAAPTAAPTSVCQGANDESALARASQEMPICSSSCWRDSRLEMCQLCAKDRPTRQGQGCCDHFKLEADCPIGDGTWVCQGAHAGCQMCAKDHPLDQGCCDYHKSEGLGCSWAPIGAPVPVDGVWSSWTGFGACSKSCGTGTQSKTRTCTAPSFGGKACAGATTESQNCNTVSCPCPQVRCANYGPCKFVPSALLNADGCPMHPCGIRTCKTFPAPTAANCPITCMAFAKDGAHINGPSVKTVDHILTQHMTSNGDKTVDHMTQHSCTHNQETGICACTCK